MNKRHITYILNVDCNTEGQEKFIENLLVSYVTAFGGFKIGRNAYKNTNMTLQRADEKVLQKLN